MPRQQDKPGTPATSVEDSVRVLVSSSKLVQVHHDMIVSYIAFLPQYTRNNKKDNVIV